MFLTPLFVDYNIAVLTLQTGSHYSRKLKRSKVSENVSTARVDAPSLILISETRLSSSPDLFLHCTFHSQSSSLQTFLDHLSNKVQLKKNSPVSKMMHRYSYSSSINEMRHYPDQQDIFTWVHFTCLHTQIPHIYSSQSANTSVHCQLRPP